MDVLRIQTKMLHFLQAVFSPDFRNIDTPDTLWHCSEERLLVSVCLSV